MSIQTERNLCAEEANAIYEAVIALTQICASGLFYFGEYAVEYGEEGRISISPRRREGGHRFFETYVTPEEFAKAYRTNAPFNREAIFTLIDAAKTASATLGHAYHTVLVGGLADMAHNAYQSLDSAIENAYSH